jgi:fibrillarin-like rRNA methylase
MKTKEEVQHALLVLSETPAFAVFLENLETERILLVAALVNETDAHRIAVYQGSIQQIDFVFKDVAIARAQTAVKAVEKGAPGAFA